MRSISMGESTVLELENKRFLSNEENLNGASRIN